MGRKRRGGAPARSVRPREHPRRTHITLTDVERRAALGLPTPKTPPPAAAAPGPARPWLGWRELRGLRPAVGQHEARWARNTAVALLLALGAAAAWLAR